MPTQFPNRTNILRLLSIRPQPKPLGHLPQENLPIITPTRHNIIVERIPIRVQHRRRMPSKQRQLFGKLPALFQRNDSKCAAAGRLPVDGEVLGVCFDEVGVPGVVAYA